MSLQLFLYGFPEFSLQSLEDWNNGYSLLSRLFIRSASLSAPVARYDNSLSSIIVIALQWRLLIPENISMKAKYKPWKSKNREK